jgi:xylan 1,4-beta-xylosidase
MEPIEWTADGWFRAMGGDLSKPIRKPAKGKQGPAGFALSDDFSADRFGIQWCFHDPKPDEMKRVERTAPGLMLTAAGNSPLDSTPLACIVPDRAYQAEVTLQLSDASEAGLLLFYNHKAFVGVGFTPDTIKTYQYAEEQVWARLPHASRRVRVRMTNDRNVITYEYSYDDGRSWKLHPTRMEVSGMHHNVFGGFLSLKVGIYSAAKGNVLLSDFRYRGMDRFTDL